MSRLEYWDEIKGFGTFQLEMELVVSTEPVLFVCIKDEERYLFMTYDSYDGVYVFCKISTEDLLRMLQNEITMENAFRMADCIYQTYVDEDNSMNYFCYESASFDGSKLPKVGAYYRINSNYIKKYINELEQESLNYLEYDYSINNSTFQLKLEFNEIEAVCMMEDQYIQIEELLLNSAVNKLYEKNDVYAQQVVEKYEEMKLMSDKEIDKDFVA